jgi:hypothetical protein
MNKRQQSLEEDVKQLLQSQAERKIPKQNQEWVARLRAESEEISRKIHSLGVELSKLEAAAG